MAMGRALRPLYSCVAILAPAARPSELPQCHAAPPSWANPSLHPSPVSLRPSTTLAATCPYRSTRSKRYASTYLVTDVLACLPLNCIMMACDGTLNYYNTGELLK